MFDNTRAFLRRNARPLTFTLTFATATYLTVSYLFSKLTESRQRTADERIARENLRRRFAQNQEDCTYTVLALVPTATENVVSALGVEVLTEELMRRRGKVGESLAGGSSVVEGSEAGTGVGEGESAGSGSYVHASQAVDGEEREKMASKSKIQLWNDVKISSITRAVTLIYTLGLLSLFTRIQLNLLGRRNYLSSVVSLATPSTPDISLENRDDDNLTQDYGSDFDTNRMYLTFSWWLLHRGWIAIREKVETVVADVFETLNPRDNVEFERLSGRILEMRKRIEGETDEERRRHPWLDYLLPEKEDEDAVLKESGVAPISPAVTDADGIQRRFPVSSSLRRLLDETSDIVESPTFSHVLTLTLDAAFSLLIDEKVAIQAYQIPIQNKQSSQAAAVDDQLLNNPLLSPERRVQEVSNGRSDDSDPADKLTTCKLAKTLAVITRQAYVIGSGGNISTLMASSSTSTDPPTAFSGPSFKEANEYLAAMESVRDVEGFAAVVYSSNFELEGVEDTSTARESNRRDNTHGDDSPVDASRELETDLESAWGKAMEPTKSPQ